MAILPILTYDDDVLYRETEPVEESTSALQQLIDDMFETMYNADGVGLAAPQVDRTERVFVIDADSMAEEDGEEGPGPLVMINPEITFASDRQVEIEEGCLSIPGVNAAVRRPEEIEVAYLDRDLERQRLRVNGILARVIQHETDHLHGVLFLDHLSVFKRKLLGSKLREIADGRIEADYPLAPK
ncbi:MAG: peptide deformylase [Balneolaceae bacterium]|nr:peptide deformylase [Balneolaceae bacterium]